MDMDCSPNVGDRLEHNMNALIIAKALTAKLSDQNEYIILCAINHSDTEIEYVSWHLIANTEQFDTMHGHYFRAFTYGHVVLPNIFIQAVNDYAVRARLKVGDDVSS